MNTSDSHPVRIKLISVVVLAAAAYLAIVLPYLGYFPLWDTLFYLDDYLFKARDHLTLHDFFFTNSGHPCPGYYWLFWIGQWLFPNSMLTVQLINIALGLLAIGAFAHVAFYFFRGLVGWAEITLITLCFAIHPVFVAYAVNMLMEYGVLAYLLATLWLIQARRLGWAALVGFLLVFSKETGVVLYTLPVLLLVSGLLGPWRWRDLLPLAVPYMTFGIYVVVQKLEGQPLSPWAVRWFGNNATLWGTYAPNPFNGEFLMACFLGFVLEFQWIFAAVIVAAVVAGLLAPRGAGGGYRAWLQKFNVPLLCLVFLIVGCLYCCSRTVTFANPRYVLVLYPFILLAFLAALLQLRVPARARIVVLAASLILLFCCNFRTLDPVSRAITGTFPFGQHSLLSIATVRPDVGALNRDELVYNLEHTHISYLMDRAMEAIKPTPQTSIVVQGDAWYVLTRLDPRTYHRTELLTAPCFPINLRAVREIQKANGPKEIFVFELPYFHNTENRAGLNRYYDLQQRMVFSEHGYELDVCKMTLKPGIVR